MCDCYRSNFWLQWLLWRCQYGRRADNLEVLYLIYLRLISVLRIQFLGPSHVYQLFAQRLQGT